MQNLFFYQSSSVEGEFRTRDLEIIAGDDKTETEYKESGCRFIVDVRKAFFSPRLSSERIRISELVNDGEVIVNMFGRNWNVLNHCCKKEKMHCIQH